MFPAQKQLQCIPKYRLTATLTGPISNQETPLHHLMKPYVVTQELFPSNPSFLRILLSTSLLSFLILVK